jgi:hypothetical protein
MIIKAFNWNKPQSPISSIHSAALAFFLGNTYQHKTNPSGITFLASTNIKL